ncbi:MAG: hypothetical protein WAV66_15425 [Anaerolineae bacterium]
MTIECCCVCALDVRWRRAEGRFCLFFDARSDWPWWRGRERIGLLVGDL